MPEVFRTHHVDVEILAESTTGAMEIAVDLRGDLAMEITTFGDPHPSIVTVRFSGSKADCNKIAIAVEEIEDQLMEPFGTIWPPPAEIASDVKARQELQRLKG